MQSNCVAVLPNETDSGRKRKIDQSSCNKDYSCAKGFCPSFVGVLGGGLKKRVGALAGAAAQRFAAEVAGLPLPRAARWTGPYDLLVTGVGGTGVVTVGALIAMAAHLEGKSASVLDFMGFAQKGGSVLSFVRLAREQAAALNQVRIDAQQADAMLACDVVVGASAEALGTVRHGRTRVLANVHEIPVAESLTQPRRRPAASTLLLDKLEFAAGAERVETLDAQTLAEDFLGDSIVANIVAMGYAWQRGLVPVGLAAMQRAIELNGRRGRRTTRRRSRSAASPRPTRPPAASCCTSPIRPACVRETLDELIEPRSRILDGLPERRYARALSAHVEAMRAASRRVVGADRGAAADPRGRRAVAASLMAYKDEYEVGRLYTDGAFERQLPISSRARPAPRVLHGAAGAGEAEGRHRRAAQGPSRPLALPAAQGAGSRQGPARHGVRSVRPHRRAPPGARA